MGGLSKDSLEYVHFLSVKAWYRAHCNILYRHVMRITAKGSDRRTKVKALLKEVATELFKVCVHNASTKQQHLTKQHIGHMVVEKWPRDLVWPLHLSWEALIA